MLKSVAILAVLLLPGFFPYFRQDPPPQTGTPPAPSPAPYTVPVKDARQPNPVKPTAESIARGKKLYGYDCAMCHGKDGYGKGDVATDLKLKIEDFSNPAALKGLTDGELFYIIKNGKGQMPPEGDRVKPERIWDMVNYIRTFAGEKSGAEKTSAPPEEPN
jgi:mono/diheme cytochrome c family protein